MGMKKIKKAINEYAEKQWDRIYNDGFNNGSDDGYNHGYDEGYTQGIKAERERIIEMFEMLSRMNMENGTATKAKQYFDAAQLVKVADTLENNEFVDEDVF